MKNTRYCPKCAETREVRVEVRQEAFKVGEDLIPVQSKVAVCTVCGTDLVDPELENDNMLKVYTEYRKRHNLLMPEEIRALRERLGVSQEVLAEMLGWPRNAIKRYENGSLQDEARDKVLRKLNDPSFVADLLKNAKPILNP